MSRRHWKKSLLKRSWHFLRKDLLYLLRCWRLRELSDSQNFCCRDYWEIGVRHFLGLGRLVLNVIHIQLLSSIRDCPQNAVLAAGRSWVVDHGCVLGN